MIKEHYTIKDFLPLITIFLGISAVAGYIAFTHEVDLMLGMRVFMAGFFIIFGLLKVSKLGAFAEAYQMYDLIAKRSLAYAYVYPFIELSLGISYAFNVAPTATNLITVIVMLISALGVYIQLQKREPIMCACLGTVFKVPMTWVTLSEDLLMAAMAGVSLLI